MPESKSARRGGGRGRGKSRLQIEAKLRSTLGQLGQDADGWAVWRGKAHYRRVRVTNQRRKSAPKKLANRVRNRCLRVLTRRDEIRGHTRYVYVHELRRRVSDEFEFVLAPPAPFPGMPATNIRRGGQWSLSGRPPSDDARRLIVRGGFWRFVPGRDPVRLPNAKISMKHRGQAVSVNCDLRFDTQRRVN